MDRVWEALNTDGLRGEGLEDELVEIAQEVY
jgi:hypothetical protein